MLCIVQSHKKSTAFLRKPKGFFHSVSLFLSSKEWNQTNGKVFQESMAVLGPRRRRSSSSNSSTRRSSSWNNKELMTRLYQIAEPERKLILASAATLGVTSSITLILPYACGEVLDMAMMKAAGHSSSSWTFSPFLVATGLFGLTGVAGLGVYARSLMLNIAGNRIVSRMRQQLFRSIIAQEAAFFDGTKSGELISRLSNDCYFIKSAVTTETVSGLRGVIMSLGSTTLLFYTSPKLAIVSLCSIPPVFLAARLIGRTLKEKQNVVQDLHGKATNIAEEVFTGHKTVQLFATERNEIERYSNAINYAHEKEISVGKTRAAFDGIVHVAANGAVLLVLGYGGSLVLANEMTAGDLTGFLMYSLLMAGNISSLSGTYTEMMKSMAAAGRTFDIIDRIPSIPSSFQSQHHSVSSSQRALETHKGPISVQFHNVSFSYPTRTESIVLGPKFNLDIKAGENIAIVGGSGSGKSTAGSLLCRLYDLDKGNIFLNGIDIMDLDPSFVRRQVGVVSQEPMLFAGTIKENIRYGNLSATDEEVTHAARAAHVLNFTDYLPNGLETQVGHSGSSQLSGGQKQRVAIARVLLKDPPIVILDEATSALDGKSEYHINEAIKSMSRGRTVISIAHRMSTIKEADRVAVLKDGGVAEIGAFHELIQSHGDFYNLMEQQLKID
jgi:ABC-type multidrug transport system fused ATPase/permease subunit